MFLIWAGFILAVVLMLAIDLGVFHRKVHVIGVRESLAWSGVWIALALTFGVFIYFGYESHWLGLGMTPDSVERTNEFPKGTVNDGASAAMKYVTGYVVEKSLSVDNIFVIAMLFGFFAVSAIYQHRVLFWGILGAIVLRGVMIGVGAELIARFAWILYVFGAFLIATAVKMLVLKTDHTDLNANIVVKLTRRFFPVTEQFHGQHFLVRAGSKQADEPEVPGSEIAAIDRSVKAAKPGTLMLTPLGLALIMIEFTDLIFAVDSIPAIFAITADPFLVFTSNIFAILGLRALYFALAGAMQMFRYLKVSLAVVLGIVGGKMLAHGWLKTTFGPNINVYLLVIVLLILAVGVVASLIAGRHPAGMEGHTNHQDAGAHGAKGSRASS